ncbi:CinA family protein [Methylophaga sp. OBS4]|uniref:CinA family protein n=1 Tax=Methylophaga sp. OBS4 TaxID=2991935 RepID=UPI002255B6AC|nr:CinA family protein [Methylophaga sp. OBS4]MCX4186242.1 CinA family protein [Methylophaga sp. OBS4]
MQTISDVSLQQISLKLAELLIEKKLKLVTAESCTGGWVAKCCTDIPGSSAWFERGFVTYSNEAKQTDLGVAEATLIKTGAVSLATVEEMAFGALSRSNADISVAITGIAGPDGGSESKPVGTVWIGWAGKNKSVHSICYHFKGNRESIRRQAVLAALEGVIKNASALPG